MGPVEADPRSDDRGDDASAPSDPDTDTANDTDADADTDTDTDGGGGSDDGDDLHRAEATDPVDAGARPAAWVFAVVVVLAAPLILHLGDDQWFFLDEWAFIAGRELNVDDLLRPHNEHLVALPVLLYRITYQIFGLTSYVPYQAMVVGAHLVAAVLLRVIMRRAGVGPWVATLVASVFVVFGSGRQDIVWAFQITFTGAVACGLAAMLLADHEGRIGWRDALAVAFGVAAVSCSGVGVLMVGAVGLATLLRRGWFAAAVQVVPPALLWLAWYASRGRDAVGEASGVDGAVDYAWNGLSNAIQKIGQIQGMGIVLAVSLIAGIILAVQRVGPRASLRTYALPLALALAGVGFLVVTGFARAGRTGNDIPQATRYVYVVGATVVPVLAVAIDAIARRSRLLAVIPAAALLIGVPGNVGAIRADGFEELTLGRPDVVLVGANMDEMRQVPRDRSPFSWFEGPITAGWLVHQVDRGKVPDAPDVSPTERADILLEVALDLVPGPHDGDCTPLTEPRSVRLLRGDALAFQGGGITVTLVDGDARSTPTAFGPDRVTRLEAAAGPLDLLVEPSAPGTPVTLCEQPKAG